MPTIKIRDQDLYYELDGAGPPLVLTHGAFVDAALWDSQFQYFSKHYQVLRYDLRGHGRTGPSDLNPYTMGTFTDDLTALLDALKIETAVVCGLSLGGMIAQDFAVKNPERLRALVLADTAVSVSLTLSDKLQTYVLFPYWAMRLTIRLMTVPRFTRFSFWLTICDTAMPSIRNLVISMARS